MKHKRFKIIIVLLICSNIFFITGFIKKSYTIDLYHKNVISIAQIQIASAYNNMDLALSADDDFRKAAYMEVVESNFTAAKHALSVCSVYFNYKSNDNLYYIGNIDASDFFRNMKDVLNDWQNAYYTESKEKPSDEALEDYLKDIKSLTEAFQVYANVDYSDVQPIEDMNYEDIKSIFIDLARKTQSKTLYDYHRNSNYGEFLD